MKVKQFFKHLFGGMAIGVGAAIPGVSGAAIAMILKIYNSIISSVNNLRKHFKDSMRILLPLAIGALIAVGVCIFVFDWAFEYAMFAIVCAFAGFLVGSFPGIKDEIKDAEKSNKNFIICVICAVFVILIGVLSIILGNQGFGVGEAFKDLNKNWWMYLVLIPVGALASVALTVPGLSGSLILVIIGFYMPLVTNAKDWISQLFHGDTSHLLNLILVILCFAVGCFIGIVLISKVMSKLLTKYHDPTYFGITGFVLGSIVVLFLNKDIFAYYQVWSKTIPIYIEIIIGVVLFIGSLILSYLLVRYQRKQK